MKYKAFLIGLIIAFGAEILAVIWFMDLSYDSLQDSVVVNEAVKSVQADWNNMDDHNNSTGLDYTVIDSDGKILFRTRTGLSESINEAVIHCDTILDIEANGKIEGKIIIYNDSSQRLAGKRRITAATVVTAAVIQFVLCAIYSFYLKRTVIKPFKKLKEFAKNVAGGNLDIPLEMDRGNIFGSFTESFDIMRSELKKSRAAEAHANASKRELVAKLSHDIRTPVASIKAASEVGAAAAKDEKTRQNYIGIIHKADQVSTLITNLFSSALEDLQQLTVEPEDIDSSEIFEMLEGADYLHYSKIPDIPQCLIYADRLRLQQVFDNIFANSYKYASTKIDVAVSIEKNRLLVKIEDRGGGVSDKDMPFLKEKFRRGNNSANIEGAGLGLYISDCFMKEMKGELVIENGHNGLAAKIFVALSGTI